jgi:hypothetical protein
VFPHLEKALEEKSAGAFSVKAGAAKLLMKELLQRRELCVLQHACLRSRRSCVNDGVLDLAYHQGNR